MNCKKCGNELIPDTLFCTKCGMKIEREIEDQIENEIKRKSHRNCFVQIILGIMGLGILAAVIFVGMKLYTGMNQGESKGIVYLQEDEIYYMRNMEKDEEPIYIASINSELYYLEDSVFNISEDGKYLYFLSKTDIDLGKLYYVDLQSLTYDKEKNEKYIKEIDNNIDRLNYHIIGDREIIYIKGNGKLCYYNGSNEKDIIEKSVDSNVIGLGYSGEKGYINYTKESADGVALYAYSISKDESTKLDEDIEFVYNLDSPNGWLVYSKESSTYDEENLGFELYCAEPEGKARKIDDDVCRVLKYDEESKHVYFIKENTRSRQLYEYVNDGYADEDAHKVEPSVRDYFYEVTALEAMDEEGLSSAWDEYEACDRRIALREALQTETIQERRRDIYCYKDGEVETIVTEVVDATGDVDKDFIYYIKDNGNTSKLDIGTIDSTDTVREWIQEQSGYATTRYYMINGRKVELEEDVAFFDWGVSEDRKHIVGIEYTEDKDIAYLYEIKDGKLTNKEKITDQYNEIMWFGNTLFFTEYDESGSDKQTLYKFADDKKQKITNIPYYSVFYPYEEDNMLILEDYDSYAYTGKLVFVNGNAEKEKIANDVSDFSYINDKYIVYLKENNLYLYTGDEEHKRISKDVTTFKCIGENPSI